MNLNRVPDDRSEPASAAAISGLGAEVEALRELVGRLLDLPGRVEQLGQTVTDAVEELARARRGPEAVRPLSWLAHQADEAELTGRLDELADWVAQVYLRYAPAGRSLPDCWLWHPDVVEELAWLHLAWQTAYHPQLGSVAAAGDWHDRQRPGVASRIRAAAGTCSLQAHLEPIAPDPTAPAAEATPLIADWWAIGRTGVPPAPPRRLVEAARARRTAAARGARR